MEIVNFYESLPKEFREEQSTYSNFTKLHIKLPAMINVVGATGSGKTNTVVNMIRHMGCFTRIYLFAKNLEEPLYAWMIDLFAKVEKKTGVTVLMSGSDLAQLPAVSDINKEETNLLIIDDMITENKKKLNQVVEYFIRARKQNCSCIFISQAFYRTPGDIRKNTQYVILKKIATGRDLKSILREYSLGVDDKQLLALYKYATAGDPLRNFLMIDIGTNDPNLRFRKNYTGIPVKIEGMDGEEGDKPPPTGGEDKTDEKEKETATPHPPHQTKRSTLSSPLDLATTPVGGVPTKRPRHSSSRPTRPLH